MILIIHNLNNKASNLCKNSPLTQEETAINKKVLLIVLLIYYVIEINIKIVLYLSIYLLIVHFFWFIILVQTFKGGICVGTMLSFVNNKGGSTKTTSTVNFAGAYAVKNPSKKVLIVETDGQGNAALSYNVDTKDLEYTTYDIFMGNQEAENCIVNAHMNIDMIPANDDMNFLEYDLMRLFERNYKQGKTLGSITSRYFNMIEGKFDKLKEKYDLIIFDTPPEIKAITSSVLSVVDEVVIPYEADAFAVQGVVNIVKRINDIKENYNPKLNIAGLMAVKVDSRTKVHTTMINKMMRYAKKNNINHLLAEIPRSIRFADAATFKGVPATLKSGSRMSKFEKQYYVLLEELINDGVLEGEY